MNLSRLRIAHIQPIAFDIFGHRDEDWGTSVRYFLPNLVSAQTLQNDCPSVHLLTSSRAKSITVDGVDVHFHRCIQLPRVLPVTMRFGRQVSLSMLNAIRHDKADIIHFHGSCSLHLMYGAVALRARQQKMAIISQDHGPRTGRWLERQLWRIALQNTTASFAANAESMETLETLGVPRQSISILPNGFDPNVFYPGPPTLRDPANPLKVLVVSRLWKDKDPLTMAKGLAILAHRGHKVDLTIIGQGILRREVEQELRTASVRATFVEHTSQSVMADYYRSSDVLVLTSLREGWNQATIEAMACGLPVVATDIPGIRDGVGDAGILLPIKRPDLLADALQYLAINPHRAVEHRNRGILRSQRYTWSEIASQLRQVYLSCIASQGETNAAAHDSLSRPASTGE